MEEKINFSLSLDLTKEIIIDLKELVKFASYENIINNPFYSSIDIYILNKKIKYLENLINNIKKNNDKKDSEYEKKNNN